MGEPVWIDLKTNPYETRLRVVGTRIAYGLLVVNWWVNQLRNTSATAWRHAALPQVVRQNFRQRCRRSIWRAVPAGGVRGLP